MSGRPLGASEIARLVAVELEEATSEADAATIVATLEADDREWRSALDELVQPGTTVAIALRRDTAVYRFVGRAVSVHWTIERNGSSRVRVGAVDRSIELGSRERVQSWQIPDGAIAERILKDNGMHPDVEPTPDRPDPDVHVVMQRASDWDFLRSLAAKWGYALYLEARDEVLAGVFRTLDVNAAPQATLDLGAAAEAGTVTAEVRLAGGRAVEAARIGSLSSAVLTGADAGVDQAQGARPLGGEGRMLLSPMDVDGEIDPAAAARAAARRVAFGATLEAEADPARTGLIRARRTVRVRGVGSVLSGLWLVERVRHRWEPRAHGQRVTLARNALGTLPPPGPTTRLGT